MNRRNMILGALAVVGVGGWYLTSNPRSGSTPVNPLANAANAQTSGDVDTSSVPDMVLGNPDAAVTITEYASFTCPHCAAFHEGTFKKLKADYIDTGKIKFVYREVYFDRPGIWASLIARCGGEEKFFGIVDLIYKSQSTWARAGDPAAIVEELRKIGRLAGLDSDTIEACLQDGKQAETLYAWYQENGKADDIDSTPSFIINGTKYSNMAYDKLKDIIETELAG
ncbi:thioredoxin domain-containing protein [Sulfitobacter mediterraneus]|jgi:protein-disulfide isomerase|uniref:DsbA family protein n=1 Tax=Sulfitobacter mediterraneus TaxID=83219 RepID=UPI001931CE61|nr:thioredoxin domain-containing protein [Sulfitobacter mediterraneus]MBM1632704.1 thioredoxin domain-containing protein [Sulfitobacter mediterraneus]MBM1641162.1 thioredoxin domain-containing protein [Sulfitobacter mediterraneus]MBM1644569.1 thioredoxin domain-containing protein [Sulfitobacter mediterraneus]MBM1649282.1 thioredoxin domain-containing protein [Sulfitobacter mediterraneus]MBM1653303.1 thioredoxin domain-containing protein [Sulfitobacter mediterraneus]